MTERESMILTTPPNVAPRTEGGQWGIVMLKSTGKGPDSQWFDLRPGFYQPIIRVEWEHDTMAVAIPQSIAETLLKKGYARMMTLEEAKKYNDEHSDTPATATEVTPPPKATAPVTDRPLRAMPIVQDVKEEEPVAEPPSEPAAHPAAAPPPQSSATPPQRQRRRLSEDKEA